jgi:dTDP-4-amino-4,6-dideoxygalactose transaminase
MSGEELEFIHQAFDSNYIAPLGPMVDAFEREFAEYVGIKHCLALSSGTAAMHLALRILGVGQADDPGEMRFAPHLHEFHGVKVLGDDDRETNDKRPFVIASTLTFIGSVTPVVFQGASLVFVDCDRVSWNMDPELLAGELEACNRRGKLPKAVVPTDLYGQCCDLPRIVEICDGYGVPVVCDSAESLGGRYLTQSRKDAKIQREYKKSFLGELGGFARESSLHAGVGAKAAVFSFNGNKIITTSGGGMLASDDREFVEQARKLSQQAREDFPHYEHTEIGYNYRMSNILAAIGRGQLKVLDERVKRKREIFDYYQKALGDLPGIEFMPEAEWSRSNRWLTVILVTAEEFGSDRETVRLALEAENIEARPVWKPMHMQPVFGCGSGFRVQGLEAGENDPQISQIDADYKKKKKRYKARMVGGEVAEDLFDLGLCLPSGTAMTEEDLDRVIGIIRKCHRQ